MNKIEKALDYVDRLWPAYGNIHSISEIRLPHKAREVLELVRTATLSSEELQVAAILHDVPYYSDIEHEEIVKEFGKGVAQILHITTSIKYRDPHTPNYEYAKQIYQAKLIIEASILSNLIHLIGNPNLVLSDHIDALKYSFDEVYEIGDIGHDLLATTIKIILNSYRALK